MKACEPTVITKSWGTEEVIVNNSLYCGKRMTVYPGLACSIHYHDKKTETFFVVSGNLVLELYEPSFVISGGLADRRLLLPGRSLTIMPKTPHRFWVYGNTAVVFMEFSTPDSPADSFRELESGPVPAGVFLTGDPW